ncbi:HlyD family secretion protein [uncultured Thiothrix sp.]|uniref:HlyD family secretion protein n=1 Tax=uncultured Thiothrix sp. TaxID=223185 RepID=UPI002633399C|nr:HlyD family secretion protein [uncultured Thiothrix sp.]
MSEPAQPTSDATAPIAPKPARKNKTKRLILLVVIPLIALTIGGYFYLKSGRYVETENAYIKTDKIPVSTPLSGVITKVLVKNNQLVKQGDTLFTIDDASYQVDLHKAEAQLAQVRNELATLRAAYSMQPSAQTAAALGGSVNTPTEEHPSYLLAQAALDAAKLNIARSVIVAPEAGTVYQPPQQGQYITAGSTALVLVADTRMWIEANIPETDLTYVQVGQPVEIKVDTYPKQTWSGEVESISPATGAEFSVIPAQNATGNWVKIAQRLPVRIKINPEQGQPPLQAGLSTTISIDTKHERQINGISLSALQTQDVSAIQKNP